VSTFVKPCPVRLRSAVRCDNLVPVGRRMKK